MCVVAPHILPSELSRAKDMDRTKCMTPLAAEVIERIARSSELEQAIGGDSAGHLVQRAQAVYSALGDPGCVRVPAAVAELVRDCVTLPSWADPGFEGGDGEFCWAFGPAVAEIIAASVAAVAGLTEPGCLPDWTLYYEEIFNILENLGRELDSMGPYLFAGLGRVAGGNAYYKQHFCQMPASNWETIHAQFPQPAGRSRSKESSCNGFGSQDARDDPSKTRLQVALQAICGWSLAAVARIVGYERFSPRVLWEWGSQDALWVIVLAKGALTLEDRRNVTLPLSELLGISDATLLAAPSDLAYLQDAVLAAVFGLSSADVAFASEVNAADDSGDFANSKTISMRESELALHRATLASTVCHANLVGPIIRAAAREGISWSRRAQLVSFFVDLLQPSLSPSEGEPAWAAREPCNLAGRIYPVEGVARGSQVLSQARSAASELGPTFAWHAEELWGLLSSVPPEAAASSSSAPLGFVQNCANLAVVVPCAGAEFARLLHHCVLATSDLQADLEVVVSLCVLAANAALRPGLNGDGGLSDALTSMPLRPQREHIAERMMAWRGPVNRPGIAEWLEYLRQADLVSFGQGHQLEPPREAAPSLEPCPMPAPTAVSCTNGGLSPGGLAPSGLRELLQGAPRELRCSLDGGLLVDPVRSPGGQVFERAVLSQTLAANGGRCPFSGEPLTLSECCRDSDLRRRAVAWVRGQRGAKPTRPLGFAGATKIAGAAS